MSSVLKKEDLIFEADLSIKVDIEISMEIREKLFLYFKTPEKIYDFFYGVRKSGLSGASQLLYSQIARDINSVGNKSASKDDMKQGILTTLKDNYKIDIDKLKYLADMYREQQI